MSSVSEKKYETLGTEDAKVILVAYGIMARICRGAVNKLRKEGERVGLIRPVTLWPFPDDIFKRAAKRATFLVTEMSYGQMVDDVRLALGCDKNVKFLGRSGGGVPSEEDIVKYAKNIYTS